MPNMLEGSTIAQMLAQRSVDSPNEVAFASRGEVLTYGRLAEEVASIAAAFHDQGIEGGARVAVVMPAGLDLIRAFYALQRIGAVPCLFDPHVPEALTEKRVAAIRPFSVVRSLPPVSSARTLPPLPDEAEAIAFLQSTSGTTGEPLAAIALQRNVRASLVASHFMIDPRPSDVLVGWVPPWHDLGLLRFVLGPIFLGIPCHLIPPAVKTIPEWFATIVAVKGTITGAPDFAWRLAARLVDPNRVDLRSLRYATNGGEPVRSSTVREFEGRFGLQRVIRPGYGLAEATLGVTSTPIGEEMLVDERGDVSCGTPLHEVEVGIDGDEVIVRSAGVFAGYFDAEAATRRVLRDGWLYTGDAGRLDGDGNLYVIGRMRALLKRGGATLAPRELEEAAQNVEGVRLAAAVGVEGEHTEEIVVVVEAESDQKRIELDVARAIEKEIGFAPDRVVVQAPRSIPRTSNGKIRHAMLRDQLTPSSLRSNPSVSSEGEAET